MAAYETVYPDLPRGGAGMSREEIYRSSPRAKAREMADSDTGDMKSELLSQIRLKTQAIKQALQTAERKESEDFWWGKNSRFNPENQAKWDALKSEDRLMRDIQERRAKQDRLGMTTGEIPMAQAWALEKGTIGKDVLSEGDQTKHDQLAREIMALESQLRGGKPDIKEVYPRPEKKPGAPIMTEGGGILQYDKEGNLKEVRKSEKAPDLSKLSPQERFLHTQYQGLLRERARLNDDNDPDGARRGEIDTVLQQIMDKVQGAETPATVTPEDNQGSVKPKSPIDWRNFR